MIFFWIYLLFITVREAAILQIFNSSFYELNINNDNNSISPIQVYQILTPPFDLGSRDFPITASVIIADGCSGIDKISDETAFSLMSSRNVSKLLVLRQFSDHDHGCFSLSQIFRCQRRSWCAGVLIQSSFYTAGFNMWSIFDQHRPRSEYRVPLVEAKKEDFFFFRNLVIESENNNQSHLLTISNDPNPWQEMFSSVEYFLYFRILTPIWSFCCLVLVLGILFGRIPRVKKEIVPQPQTRRKFTFRLTLKQICLLLHLGTHLSRIAFAVDPFSAYQIFPYLVTLLLISSNVAFEISSNVLLSFIIRELTRANQTINVMKKVRVAYVLITILVGFEYFVSYCSATYTNPTPFPLIYFRAFYFVVVNVVLGIWYFWQGLQYLKKCSANEKIIKKENSGRVLLTQISLMSSVGILLFGLMSVLIAVREATGHPIGYFAGYATIFAVAQITSLFEILLFGGIPVNIKKKESSNRSKKERPKDLSL